MAKVHAVAAKAMDGLHVGTVSGWVRVTLCATAVDAVRSVIPQLPRPETIDGDRAVYTKKNAGAVLAFAAAHAAPAAAAIAAAGMAVLGCPRGDAGRPALLKTMRRLQGEQMCRGCNNVKKLEEFGLKNKTKTKTTAAKGDEEQPTYKKKCVECINDRCAWEKATPAASYAETKRKIKVVCHLSDDVGEAIVQMACVYCRGALASDSDQSTAWTQPWATFRATASRRAGRATT